MIYCFWRSKNDNLYFICKGTLKKCVNEVEYLKFIGRISGKVIYTDRKHAKKFIAVSARMNLDI